MFLNPPRTARHSILIVDDDLAARCQLRSLLSANGYAVIEADNGRTAHAFLTEREIHVIVSDIFMPECDGFELIAAIRAMGRLTPVIAMSDHESWTGLNFLDAANDLGAAAVIEKPFRAQVLLRQIDEALAVARRDARVFALGALAGPQRACVLRGLEWVGGRMTTMP